MNRITKGIVAGFSATVVLSVLMLMKSMMGLMPQLDIISMLSTMAGAPDTPLIGWVLHFVIGSVLWGVLFALISPMIPGRSEWLKGIAFGTAAWLLMMIMVMPMAGAGLFGSRFGMVAPVMTLMLHILYGAVLGAVYGALASWSPIGPIGKKWHAH